MPQRAHNQGESNATFGWRICYHLAKLHVYEVCKAFEYLGVIRYLSSKPTNGTVKFMSLLRLISADSRTNMPATLRKHSRTHTSISYHQQLSRIDCCHRQAENDLAVIYCVMHCNDAVQNVTTKKCVCRLGRKAGVW